MKSIISKYVNDKVNNIKSTFNSIKSGTHYVPLCKDRIRDDKGYSKFEDLSDVDIYLDNDLIDYTIIDNKLHYRYYDDGKYDDVCIDEFIHKYIREYFERNAHILETVKLEKIDWAICKSSVNDSNVVLFDIKYKISWDTYEQSKYLDSFTSLQGNYVNMNGYHSIRLELPVNSNKHIMKADRFVSDFTNSYTTVSVLLKDLRNALAEFRVMFDVHYKVLFGRFSTSFCLGDIDVVCDEVYADNIIKLIRYIMLDKLLTKVDVTLCNDTVDKRLHVKICIHPKGIIRTIFVDRFYSIDKFLLHCYDVVKEEIMK